MYERICQSIEQNKVIAIIRKVYGTELLMLSVALSKGGLKLIEVTFDKTDPLCNKKTAEAIYSLRKNLRSDVHVGAGTVLELEQVEIAKNAGAEFIISPNSCPKIIGRTKDLGMVSIPGALSPTEVVTADLAGADYVKIFPVNCLGENYLAAIKAPLGHVRFIATGGVNANNLHKYLMNGYVGAGVGGYLSESSLIETDNFKELERRAALVMSIVKRGDGE